MDSYVDIKLLEDPDFTAPILMNVVFLKLHQALVRNGSSSIGVSFPNHARCLGDRLRLHGTEDTLANLMHQGWLNSMMDYTLIGLPSRVPSNSMFRCVRRIQAKSVHNKRKRSIAKGWLSEEEALRKIPDSHQKQLELPYLQIRSRSTQSTMRIYVEHCGLLDKPKAGTFNTYGLSREATIPWF